MEDERSRRQTDAPLPPERAFVVQLRPLATPGGELFVGRVEHISSGTVSRFGSAAELTAFIAQICDQGPRFADPRPPGTQLTDTTRRS